MEGSGEVLVPISWGIYSAGLTISRANYTLYIDQLQDSISQQVPSVKYMVIKCVIAYFLSSESWKMNFG